MLLFNVIYHIFPPPWGKGQGGGYGNLLLCAFSFKVVEHFGHEDTEEEECEDNVDDVWSDQLKGKCYRDQENIHHQEA